MRVMFFKIFSILLWPFALLFPAKVCEKLSTLWWTFRAAFLSHRFKGAKNLILFGAPLRILGGKYIELGENVILGKDCRIEATDEWCGQKFSPRIIIGDNAVINPFCHIGAIDEVRIGNYVTIAQRTYITDHLHGDMTYENLQLPPRHRSLYSRGKVVLEDCVTVGENCAIMPGVTIGAHSVIGANAVVTKNIPPYSVAVGVPAKVIKVLDPQ